MVLSSVLSLHFLLLTLPSITLEPFFLSFLLPLIFQDYIDLEARLHPQVYRLFFDSSSSYFRILFHLLSSRLLHLWGNFDYQHPQVASFHLNALANFHGMSCLDYIIDSEHFPSSQSSTQYYHYFYSFALILAQHVFLQEASTSQSPWKHLEMITQKDFGIASPWRLDQTSIHMQTATKEMEIVEIIYEWLYLVTFKWHDRLKC